MTQPTSLTLLKLTDAVRQGAAIRRRIRLMPAGGAGDKVFPPTYEGGQYAFEKRVIDGKTVDCVLLDSVQSQANRMEMALLDAHRAGEIEVPLIEVRFAGDLAEVGTITSLEAPHRIADAILRDAEIDGVRFRKTDAGRTLDTASNVNSSGLFEICPTALVFGFWDSTGGRGTLGVKFARTMVSELYAFGAEKGVKPSSRIDPLGIEKAAGPLYVSAADNSTWTLNESEAKEEKGKKVKVGADGAPSEANHGNVTPGLADKNKKPHHGGVTFDYAQQTVVLSLPALRRLRFPVGGKVQQAVEEAGRVALAALALCGATLSIARGCDLRSRCLLVPTAGGDTWEIVHGNGDVEAFALDSEGACALLAAAVKGAKAAGLLWRKEPLVLTPTAGLQQLVKKSRDIASRASAEAT